MVQVDQVVVVAQMALAPKMMVVLALQIRVATAATVPIMETFIVAQAAVVLSILASMEIQLANLAATAAQAWQYQSLVHP
jgi:hypothetical protein